MKYSVENLRIVAAGGGAPNKTSAEALERAVEMTGKDIPSVLLIPTAKRTQKAFDTSLASATDLYRDQLGLSPILLHDFNQLSDNEETIEKIEQADVAYIAGGDTGYMMKQWRHSKITDIITQKALDGRLVLSGISAGAIAPFTWGHSDSHSYREETKDNWDFIPVRGLGLVPASITPHFNTSNDRLGARADSYRMMHAGDPLKTNTTFGIGVDNFAAAIIESGKLRGFSAPGQPDHGVHIVSRNGQSHKLEANEIVDLKRF